MTPTCVLAGRRGRFSSIAPLLVCLLGCERATDGSLAARAASIATAEHSGSATPGPSASEAPTPAPILPDGCYTGVDRKHPANLVDALAEACAPGARFLLRGPGDAADPNPAFELDSPACVRVIAATAAGSRLSASLKGPDGRAVAQSALDARFALLDRGGPICLTQPGRYSLGLSTDTRAAVHYAVLGPGRH